MSDTCSISIPTPDGDISFIKTGDATATLVEAGATYELENIRVSPDGLTLNCDVLGQPLGIVPHLVFQLFKEDLCVTISKAWMDNGTKDYPITNADAAEFQAFVKTSAYPAG